MAKYKTSKKYFDGISLRQPGEIIEFDDSVGEGAPEWLVPVGEGPHRVEPRRFNLLGTAGLSVLKRAEIFSTTRPSTDPQTGGHQGEGYRRRELLDRF